MPEVHDVLKGLRKVADEYNSVLIGEAYTESFDELKQYYGDHNNELQMPMDFMFMKVNKLSAPEFRRQIAGVEASGGWPVYVFSNHDNVRAYVRYGDGQHNDAIAKLLAGLYLTLRGTPIMYYGEEIGMTNNDPRRKEDVRDPIGITGWPEEKGRDGERTPMQWNNSKNAGFTSGKPWLPVPDSYKTHNVASELKDSESILEFYKKALALRHKNQALLDGQYIPLNESDSNVLSYLRKYKDEAVLVVLNMSSEPQKASFNLDSQGFSVNAKTLLSTNSSETVSNVSQVSLEPFGVYIAQLSPAGK
jgi:alpha-glucosidase